MLYLVIAGLQGADLAELATRLAQAQSDTEKEDAVVAITRSLGIGTYDPNGKPLYPGAERGRLDLYLYDFELRARNKRRGTPTRRQHRSGPRL